LETVGTDTLTASALTSRTTFREAAGRAETTSRVAVETGTITGVVVGAVTTSGAAVGVGTIAGVVVVAGMEETIGVGT